MRDGSRHEAESATVEQHRWLIDRRAAAALFALITIGVPLRAAHELRDAIAEPTLHMWLLFGDAALRMFVWVAFTVFIYRRSPSRRPARSPRAFIACAAAILPAIMLVPPAEDGALWAILAGEIVVVVAAAFTLVSVLFLGTCFGVLPEVRGLVTRGPYRFVRHPVYLGEIAAFVGFVVASQHLLNVLLLAVFVAGQAVRMRMEEAVLTAEFPDEYGDFATRTPRLLPRGRRPARRPPAVTPPAAELPARAV